MAYVSEQNLLEDETGDPVDHPDVEDYFEAMDDDGYVPYQRYTN
jgi:heat shock protein HspQ